MKTFQLYAKLGIRDGAPMSIQNARVGYYIPYWISNDTGATISNIKLMATQGVVGEGGGNINIGIYTSPADVDIPQLLDEEYIKANWNHEVNIGFFVEETDGIFYEHEAVLQDIQLTEASYVIGIIDTVGDIQMSDMFLWADYENNE